MKRLFLALMAVTILALPLALAGSAPVGAQPAGNWRADYFNNPDWAGSPVLTQFVPFVWFNWGFGSPGPMVPVDNFTARYTADLFFYAAAYRFDITADDEFVLTVDGVTYMDTRGAGLSGKTISAVVPMRWQGNHRVEILFREWTQTAYIFVNWQLNKPGTVPPPPPPIPPIGDCRPASDSSVKTRFGDYTPCIQQGLHQKQCFQSDGAWNSPNMGSIEMEPPIELWRACPADSTTTFPISCDPEVPQKAYKCSKTEAGYFPEP